MKFLEWIKMKKMTRRNMMNFDGCQLNTDPEDSRNTLEENSFIVIIGG
jgi:hypothetical protein